uniref:G_PROTEIN_RECEP_F1_2 domain-containing protein n=1 Tax=Steinernema glaseri TaxID=37863 RepID=A0A1I7YEK2_9BILA
MALFGVPDMDDVAENESLLHANEEVNLNMALFGVPDMDDAAENESLLHANEEVNLKFTTFSVVIYAIELPILFLGVLSLTVFLILMKRARCFHQNLRLLLANFALSFLGVIFSRYMIVVPLLISYVSNVNTGPVGFCRFAKTLHDSAVYIGGLDLVVLIAERTVATVFARVYENKKNTCIGICLVAFQWIGGFSFVIGNQLLRQPKQSTIFGRLLPCQREYLSGTALQISIGTLLVADVVAIIVFLVLLKVNRNRYKDIAGGNFSTRYLSERYQIVENIRTTKLLYPLVITYLAASLIAIGLMANATIGLSSTLESMDKSVLAQLTTKDHPMVKASIWGQSFDILVACYALLFPWLATFGHHSLWREFLKLTSRKDPRVNPSVPKRMNGDRLILNASEERELYFSNLQSQWQRESS